MNAIALMTHVTAMVMELKSVWIVMNVATSVDMLHIAVVDTQVRIFLLSMLLTNSLGENVN